MALRKCLCTLFMGLLFLTVAELSPGLAGAREAAEFFAYKTIRLVVSAPPGGAYDQRARMMSRFYGRWVPGNPNIIVENMPGGGGIVALNYIYNVAPKDGTVLCIFQRTAITAPLLQPANVRFDLLKYNWLGSFGPEIGVVLGSDNSPVKTTADLFQKEMIVGVPNAVPTPRAFNALIGTRFKIISGYPGDREVMHALERGELMGVAEASWSDVKHSYAHLLRERKIRPLLQIGLERAEDLPSIPLAQEFTKNDDDRKILEVFLSQRQLGYPVVLPPGVPGDRVKILQDAFMAMGEDQEFKVEMEKQDLKIDFSSGPVVAAFIANMMSSLPPELAGRVKELGSTK